MSDFRIGLQLYTIRDETSKDFFGACKNVKEIGYDYVEPAGFFGNKPEDVKQKFDEIGLKIFGSHIGIDSLINEFDRTINDFRIMGCSVLTIAGLPESMRGGIDRWKESALTLDEYAKRLKGEGFTLAYHNHDIEMLPIDGVLPFEVLFGETTDLFSQIDVYWVAKAELDPIEYILKMEGRIQQIHAKDLAENGQDIEIGSGRLDWKGILSACKKVGALDLIAEMDFPKKEPLESAKDCLKYLQAFTVQVQ